MATVGLMDVEDFIEEAKRRLRDWAAEERRQLRIELDETGEPILKGWDSQTILQAMMLYGGSNPRGTGMRKERERPDILETDAVISRIAKQKKGEAIRTALYLHYVFKMSYGQGSRFLHCSKNQYRDYIDQGHSWVAGALACAAQ